MASTWGPRPFSFTSNVEVMVPSGAVVVTQVPEGRDSEIMTRLTVTDWAAGEAALEEGARTAAEGEGAGIGAGVGEPPHPEEATASHAR